MLVFGAIAPHGGDILAELAVDPAVMAKTREGMYELSRRCIAARPDTVVVANPHGIMVEGAVTMGVTAWAFGELSGMGGGRIEARFETDLDFAELLAGEWERQSTPVPYCPLANSDDSQDDFLPLDWGALIPLWYAAHPIMPRPKVVILAPDRRLPREILIRAGVGIARAAQESGKRIAFIASCDLGHAHDPNGPYGYDPASAEHDAAFCEIVAAQDWPKLLTWPEAFLKKAKVDAYWQTLMLAGALGHTPLPGELLSYEAPTYFGMAVATFGPVDV